MEAMVNASGRRHRVISDSLAALAALVAVLGSGTV